MNTNPFGVNNIRDHVVRNYIYFHFGLALLSASLPVLLFTVGKFRLGLDNVTSISAYYHTPLQIVFVGIMFVVGVLLYFYKGYSRAENLALNFAGIFALFIVFFPICKEGSPGALALIREQGFSGLMDHFNLCILHGPSAVLFFACVAYVCICRSEDTVNVISDPVIAFKYRSRYRYLAGLICAVVIVAMLLYLFQGLPDLAFWTETALIWIFAVFWAIKGFEVRQSFRSSPRVCWH